MEPGVAYLHPAIMREVTALTDAAGHKPTVDRIDVNRWRITMENDRVRMTVEYKALVRGRLKWLGSTLQVDGETVPLAKTFDHFIAIFRDPDSDDAQWTFKTEMPESRAVADAPDEVQAFHSKVTHALPDASIAIGNEGRLWTVEITNGPVVMRVHFLTRTVGKVGRQRRTECKPSKRRPFTIVVEGIDRTAEFNGSLERAMAFLTGTPRPDQPTAPAIHSESETRHSNAVRVRKQSVMRI